MPTRTFHPDQLTAMGVPNDLVTAAYVDANPEYVTEHPDAAIELHDEQVGTRRWASVHHLVFRAPDDQRAWRVEYVRGLTENQDDTDPWNYEQHEVTAVEVEQVATTVMKWHAIPDVPAEPSDAELIEHARTVGMVEPEKAPAFVAAYRAHVEHQAATVGTLPVPQLADVEEQQHQAAAAECAHAWTTALDGDDNPVRDHTGRTWEHCGICGARKPAPLTMADRADHAVGMYARTAVDLEDARRDIATLRARVAELETAAAPLTAAERQFLTFALDEAADEMANRDGFTDEDTAALETFRRLAATPTGAEALAAHPDQQAGRRAILDSLGTLAHVAIWPHPDNDVPEDCDATTIEVSFGGLGRYATAYALRQVADRLDQAAAVNGDTPLDEDATTAADDRNQHLDAGVPLTPAEVEQGQADADHLAAEHPDTVESLLDEIANDIPNRRAHTIAANYLARYTRLLVADARGRLSERNDEMRAEGYRGRVAWCSGMREVAALLDVRADAITEAGR